MLTPPRYRVLHLISSGGFFGAENAVLQLARASSALGVETFVGVFENSQNPNVELAAKAKATGIETTIVPCGGKLDPLAALEIRSFLTTRKVDVLHTHGYKADTYGLLASAFLGIGRVTTCHNWPGTSAKMEFYKRLNRFLLRKFDRVVAVSPILRDDLVSKKAVAHRKISVIGNGVDVEAFGSPNASGNWGLSLLRRNLGIRSHDKVIGTVGRLSTEKGHVYLLKAFERVTKDVRQAKLLIVGDGDEMGSLKIAARELGIHGSIILTGKRDDIPSLLRLMDVFVLPSLTEGLPMAVLEAMASKIPVIATEVGAVPMVIVHRQTGILIQPKDVQGMADEIIDLLGHPDKARHLAEQGYRRIESRFSSTKMAEQYLEVYRSLEESRTDMRIGCSSPNRKCRKADTQLPCMK